MANNARVKTISPIMLLRLGLGLVFLYAGLHALIDPLSWIGFVPQWVGRIMPPATFLTIHSIFELALGAALLIFERALPATSLLAALDLAAILLLYGVDDATFRDFGLVMMALALFLLSQKQADKGE